MIDPHVHCRDWNQSYKETIEHALFVAEKAGISGIFDMPNTNPPITSKELVEKRLEKADKFKSPVFYGLYVGLTPSPQQIREAVAAWKDFFPRVVGLKMYAGQSVGDLGIIKEEEQRLVYQTLSDEGYEGVLVVHCEKESLLKPDLWNPANPKSHSSARPLEAEIKSLEDQINFASEYSFKGRLHITHISVPESVLLVDNERQRGKIKVSCGLTPHHCFLNQDLIPESKEGLLYKVNPPLRTKESADNMLALLYQEKIDWIETDHAPHILEEKLNNPFLSGFPGLPFYPHFLIFLKEKGFSEQKIKALTHDNICKIFGFNIPDLKRRPDLELFNEYKVNVYTQSKK